MRVIWVPHVGISSDEAYPNRYQPVRRQVVACGAVEKLLVRVQNNGAVGLQATRGPGDAAFPKTGKGLHAYDVRGAVP